jgi:hypothetical protein
VIAQQWRQQTAFLEAHSRAVQLLLWLRAKVIPMSRIRRNHARRLAVMPMIKSRVAEPPRVALLVMIATAVVAFHLWQLATSTWPS